MTKLRSVKVWLTRTKHRSQPWTFVIDDIGNGPRITVDERYTSAAAASAGAKVVLKSKTDEATGITTVFRRGHNRIVEFKYA